MSNENKYIVKDGVRTWEVEGDLLAESSSRSPKKPRWVEFKLYRTYSGVYVVARSGLSSYYHDIDCEVVSRNKLKPVDVSEISGEYIPCPECYPNFFDPNGVCPETPRHWAQICKTGKGVIASLMMYDKNDTEYLTNVARQLLEKAAKKDSEISDAYYNDLIE